MSRRLRYEIALVLTLTFGLSGVRALLRLANSLLSPVPLNEQGVTINATQATLWWVDLGLQLCSAAALFGYGALVLFLLSGEGIYPARYRHRDWLHGAGLAAVIGIPGLAFYVASLHFGLSKEVVPADFDNAWIEMPALLLHSAANAFAEELVVVWWLMKRLPWRFPTVLAASAVLRGSYHLYQGVSAGVGNIVMGVVFGWYYHRTGKIWPLILAHFLIDAVAFCGYALLPDLPFLTRH